MYLLRCKCFDLLIQKRKSDVQLAILYPPSYVHITDVHYRKIVGIIQYTISSIRHDAFDMNSFVESVKDLALHFIDSLLESLKTVSTCLLKNDETCQNQSVAIDTMILFNISSLLFFSWHYLTRNVYGDTERLKNWNYYQVRKMVIKH